jgi:hypothetical protein
MNPTNDAIKVGKFVVGQPENGNEMISEDQVPEGQRFPAMFRGEGVRGHRYHVFGEPRYVRWNHGIEYTCTNVV